MYDVTHGKECSYLCGQCSSTSAQSDIRTALSSDRLDRILFNEIGGSVVQYQSARGGGLSVASLSACVRRTVSFV